MDILKTQESKVIDEGIEAGIKNLTPEKIEKIIKGVLENEASARLKINLEMCVRCGLCAEACHHYMSRNRDPNFAPAAKVKNTIWEIVKRKGKVSPEFVRQMARIAYTECGTCRKCSMYCPFGLDIAYLMMLVRRMCHLLKVVPKNIQDTVNSHSATYNQMWVNEDELIDTLQWQEEDAQMVLPSATLPLDIEGAEIMYSVIAPEPKVLVQLISGMTQIMNVANISWTMPASDGWDNSNMAMFTGDFELMARIERKHWDTAARLKVKKVVMGECGHAYRGAAYDGPRWLGWQYSPIPLVHAIDFFHELVTTGKIKIAKKIQKTVTIQDPCNTIRGAGLGDKLRELVHLLCEEVIEMDPNYEHNYCCGAGGGVINCGAPWKASRLKSTKIKAEQFKKTGADLIVAPCHNCHHGVEDVIIHYGLDMHTRFLTEIITEVMEPPEG